MHDFVKRKKIDYNDEKSNCKTWMINCIFKLEEAVLMHHWSLSIAIVALADNYKIKEEG